MKRSLASLFRLLVPTLSLACFACSTAVDAPVDDDSEPVEQALTSTARAFVGSYKRPSGTGPFEIDTISLVDSNATYGRYTSTVGRAMPTTGQWRVYKTSGALRLRLKPDGGGQVTYEVERTATDGMKLTRGGSSGVLEPAATCSGVLCPPQSVCTAEGGVRCAVDPCAEIRCTANSRCVLDDDAPGTARCVPWMPSPPECRTTGCSGHICADSDRRTTCQYRPEYACYQAAICERGSDGQCGFRQTTELAACLSNPP